jgi:hypothetical protein
MHHNDPYHGVLTALGQSEKMVILAAIKPSRNIIMMLRPSEADPDQQHMGVHLACG